ncbi:hypothetical protein FACS1894166_00090 [Bacilli bacterium]|nr:hypothetical protein FACS1894166_00090 [Bacilli bacterium]
MGAFFAIGSSVTAALVCSVPNYVITSIEVHTVPYSPAPAIAGTDGRTEALFFAEETGYSQRGGRKHIFYN